MERKDQAGSYEIIPLEKTFNYEIFGFCHFHFEYPMNIVFSLDRSEYLGSADAGNKL